MFPEKVSRRTFVRGAFLTAAAVCFLPGCEMSSASPGEVLGASISPDRLQMGDVVLMDQTAYLLRHNQAYPVLDLEKYRRFSKLAQYGRRVVSVPSSLAGEYPVVERRVPPLNIGVINPFTGLLEDPKSFGGEINLFFPGFLTDEGMPYESIYPAKETFVAVRKTLEAQKWGTADTIFFTYGKVGLDHYQASDTARSPQENIDHARNFLAKLKEEFPFAQFNLIAHSLGGIFALEAARQHLDAVNNLIFINSPIRGIEKTPDRVVKTWLAKPFIGREEKVTDYLFALWSNREYQEGLKIFVKHLISSGRKLKVIISSNDPIVPKTSAIVEGADVLIVPAPPNSGGLLADLQSHGRPLKDQKALEFIDQSLGENLAA